MCFCFSRVSCTKCFRASHASCPVCPRVSRASRLACSHVSRAWCPMCSCVSRVSCLVCLVLYVLLCLMCPSCLMLCVFHVSIPCFCSCFSIYFHFYFWIFARGRSRTAATSKMERFVIIVYRSKPLTIITKRSILDVAIALDPSLYFLFFSNSLAFFGKFKVKITCR